MVEDRGIEEASGDKRKQSLTYECCLIILQYSNRV